jgi:hypothetical protein
MTDGNETCVFSPDEALAYVIERSVITMPTAKRAAACALIISRGTFSRFSLLLHSRARQQSISNQMKGGVRPLPALASAW